MVRDKRWLGVVSRSRFMITMYGVEDGLGILFEEAAVDGSSASHSSCGHWALSRLAHGKVHLYDSMQPRSLAPALIEQLHSLYGHLKSDNKMEIVLPHVLKQKGTCFAICFSVSLMLGENPSELVYAQKEQWYHIANCFSMGYLTRPPSTDRKAKRSSPPLILYI